jgi:hypothetical protein
MLKTNLIKVLIWLLLLGCVSFGVSSTPLENKSRERLKQRLEDFLIHHQRKEYEQLYGLLAKEQREGYGSVEKFIEFKKSADKTGELLLAFSAKSFSVSSAGNEALIIGCGKYQTDHKKHWLQSQVEAVYENGDWYFRSLIGTSAGFGTSPKKCR